MTKKIDSFRIKCYKNYYYKNQTTKENYYNNLYNLIESKLYTVKKLIEMFKKMRIKVYLSNG